MEKYLGYHINYFEIDVDDENQDGELCFLYLMLHLSSVSWLCKIHIVTKCLHLHSRNIAPIIGHYILRRFFCRFSYS
jgi:hypothetical protein